MILDSQYLALLAAGVPSGVALAYRAWLRYKGRRDCYALLRDKAPEGSVTPESLAILELSFHGRTAQAKKATKAAAARDPAEPDRSPRPRLASR